MAKVTTHIWYNASGEITATGRPAHGYQHRITPVGDSVLETEVDEDLFKDLHRTHVVDVQRKVLVESAKRP